MPISSRLNYEERHREEFVGEQNGRHQALLYRVGQGLKRQVGWLALSLMFVFTLIFGAFATIRHRTTIYLVIGLTASTFTVDATTARGKCSSRPGEKASTISA